MKAVARRSRRNGNCDQKQYSADPVHQHTDKSLHPFVASHNMRVELEDHTKTQYRCHGFSHPIGIEERFIMFLLSMAQREYHWNLGSVEARVGCKRREVLPQPLAGYRDDDAPQQSWSR